MTEVEPGDLSRVVASVDAAMLPVVWGPDRLGELVALASAALPDEHLTADELESICLHDGGVVLGTDDGLAAVAAVRRPAPGASIDAPGPGHLRFVAVDPRLQRRGIGRVLVEAAQTWLFDRGATEVLTGGEAPFYLWPGVDVRGISALCLFESLGYQPVGARLNLAMAVPLARRPVRGFEVARVLDDADAAEVVDFIGAAAPGFAPETVRAVEHGSCFAAWAPEPRRVLGVACHSVNRAGWVGPMFTSADARGLGVGRALLVEIGGDLSTADLRTAEIAWVGPVRFYAKAADAWVSRAFRTFRLARPEGWSAS